MKPIHLFAVVLALSCTMPLQAAVYKCEKDGVTTFSQTPCGEDAQTTSYTTVGQESQPTQTVTVKKDTNEVDKYIQQRQLKRQIKKVSQDKEEKIAQRNREMNAIRDKQMSAKNNDVAGATYLQSLAQEMAAVVEAYDTEIKSLDQQLAHLQQQLSKMEPE